MNHSTFVVIVETDQPATYARQVLRMALDRQVFAADSGVAPGHIMIFDLPDDAPGDRRTLVNALTDKTIECRNLEWSLTACQEENTRLIEARRAVEARLEALESHIANALL